MTKFFPATLLIPAASYSFHSTTVTFWKTSGISSYMWRESSERMIRSSFWTTWGKQNIFLASFLACLIYLIRHSPTGIHTPYKKNKVPSSLWGAWQRSTSGQAIFKKKVLPELLPFFTTGKSSIPNYPFYELAMFRAIYLYWLIYLYLNFIVFPNLRLNVTVPKSNCIVKFPRPDAVLEKNIVCIEFFTNFNWANVSISVYHLCFTVPL